MRELGRHKGYKFVTRRWIGSRDLMYSRVIMVNNTVLYTSIAKSLDFKSPHHTKKELITIWHDRGVVIILQYINIKYQHVYLKPTQYFMSIILWFLKNSHCLVLLNYPYWKAIEVQIVPGVSKNNNGEKYNKIHTHISELKSRISYERINYLKQWYPYKRK